jgi:hypothetical protein
MQLHAYLLVVLLSVMFIFNTNTLCEKAYSNKEILKSKLIQRQRSIKNNQADSLTAKKSYLDEKIKHKLVEQLKDLHSSLRNMR